MKWNKFNELCKDKMGDYYSVMVFQHYAPAGFHVAIVLNNADGPIQTTNIGPTCRTREAALAFGMHIVRSKIEESSTK